MTMRWTLTLSLTGLVVLSACAPMEPNGSTPSSKAQTKGSKQTPQTASQKANQLMGQMWKQAKAGAKWVVENPHDDDDGGQVHAGGPPLHGEHTAGEMARRQVRN